MDPFLLFWDEPGAGLDHISLTEKKTEFRFGQFLMMAEKPKITPERSYHHKAIEIAREYLKKQLEKIRPDVQKFEVPWEKAEREQKKSKSNNKES